MPHRPPIPRRLPIRHHHLPIPHRLPIPRLLSMAAATARLEKAGLTRFPKGHTKRVPTIGRVCAALPKQRSAVAVPATSTPTSSRPGLTAAKPLGLVSTTATAGGTTSPTTRPAGTAYDRQTRDNADAMSKIKCPLLATAERSAASAPSGATDGGSREFSRGAVAARNFPVPSR